MYGENLEKTGDSSDIHANNTFIDRLEERDPHLQHAIQYLLQELNQ